MASAAMSLALALSLSGCDPREWFVCAIGACGVVLDEAAPRAPTGLTATPGDGRVVLGGRGNTEPDLFDYKRLPRNGTRRAYTALPSTGAQPAGPSRPRRGQRPRQRHHLLLRLDGDGRSGNESARSGEASATPVRAPPQPRPTPPTLGARGDFFSEVHLSRTERAGAVNYHVFRSTTPGGPYGRVASADQRSETFTQVLRC